MFRWGEVGIFVSVRRAGKKFFFGGIKEGNSSRKKTLKT
jgi:hypothetical protein